MFPESKYWRLDIMDGSFKLERPQLLVLTKTFKIKGLKRHWNHEGFHR